MQSFSIVRVRCLTGHAVVFFFVGLLVVLGCSGDVEAGKNNRDDAGVRVRINRLERDLKAIEVRQKQAEQTMEAAVAEGERVQPLLDSAREAQSAARSVLTESRRTFAVLKKEAESKVDSVPAVQAARSALDEAEESRNKIAAALESELMKNSTYRATVAERDAAARALEAAKTSGDEEARASAAIAMAAASNRHAAYRRVSLLEHKGYREAFEAVAGAEHRLAVARQEALASTTESSGLDAAGIAVGESERAYREATAVATKHSRAFLRARGVYQRAEREIAALQSQAREIQDEISDLNASGRKSRKNR